MHCGCFNKDFSEYIIDTPHTPRSWINYLTNGLYTAVISADGAGYSFYNNNRKNSILPDCRRMLSHTESGRYVYLRDKSTGAVWSATYHPVAAEYAHYEARYGIGYVSVSQTVNHIDSKILYFVPINDTCEIWYITLTNKDKKTKHLQIFPACSWSDGQSMMFDTTWYDKKNHAIIHKKQQVISADSPLMFFASTLSVKGFTTSREDFVFPSHTFARPHAVHVGKLADTTETTGEPAIGALLHEITLKPHKSITFGVLVGIGPTTSAIGSLVRKYHHRLKIEKAFEITAQYWKNRIHQSLAIKTPDPAFDAMINGWLKYQIVINTEGAGIHSLNNLSHNIEAHISIDRTQCKETILSLAQLIREDGSVAPEWITPRVASAERPHKDHPLYFTSLVYAYIKETGDRSILTEQIPYLRDRYIKGWYIDHGLKPAETPPMQGSMYEHIWKTLDYSFHDVDESGLPRIGFGDISPAIDRAGINHKGGSVWLAMCLVRSLKILARLSDMISEREKASELRKRAVLVTERIERYWDGEWYQRGITDDSYIFGGHKNKEGKIFLLPQVWAVLSGVARRDRMQKLFKSIEKYLDDQHGVCALHPPYSVADARIGTISILPRGMADNGSIDCAANAQLAVAYVLDGKGEKAYQTLKKVLLHADEDVHRYKAEPFVACDSIVGRGHSMREGAGVQSWETAAASWIFCAAVEWLLGVRPELNGLMIDPCIPKQWKQCHITRIFRGVMYDITIENPQGCEKGIKEILVNNEKMYSNVVIPPAAAKKVMVKIILGPQNIKKSSPDQVIAAL